MHIEILKTEDQWAAMHAEWNALLANSAMDVPFLRHEYLWAWWQGRGGGEWPQDSELHIALGRTDDGELRAIAPLFHSAGSSGQPALFLLGSIEISDFLDFIAREEDLPAFCEALLAALTAESNWHCLDLHNLLEDSPTLGALFAAAEKAKLRYEQVCLQPAPIIELPDSYDDYLESLNGKDRQELRRKLRNAGGFFLPVRLRTVDADADMDAEIDKVISLMVNDAEKAAFMTPAMDSQMRALLKAAADAGFLRISFLMAGDETAAGVVCFDYGNRIWGYNGGMDPRFDKLAPGVVLMALDLEDVIAQGREAYDLMRGDEEYKYRFGAVDRWVVRASVTLN